MALIKCPECNREVSSLANSCPFCGAPIAAILSVAAKSVQLHFFRANTFRNSAIWGFVLVDNYAVGKALSGASFDYWVEPGQHIITVDTRNQGRPDHEVVKTYSTTINVPSNARKVNIEIVPSSPSFSTVLKGAGAEMTFGNIKTEV